MHKVYFAYDPLEGQVVTFAGEDAPERAEKCAQRMVEGERQAVLAGCGDPRGGVGICWGVLQPLACVKEANADLALVTGGVS